MKEEIADLVKYRFDRAHGALRQAEALVNIGELDGAMNRAYYAMLEKAKSFVVKAEEIIGVIL